MMSDPASRSVYICQRPHGLLTLARVISHPVASFHMFGVWEGGEGDPAKFVCVWDADQRARKGRGVGG